MGLGVKLAASALACYGLLLLDVEQLNLSELDIATAFMGPRDIFDTCTLVDIPTWTPELRGFLQPDFDPTKNCNHSFVPWTYLDAGGRVIANKSATSFKGITCFARHILHNGDKSVIKSGWIPLEEGHVFENDIVEAECRRGKNVIYQYLHMQTWRNLTEMPFDESEAEARNGTDSAATQPSVYIILYDSISSSHGRRVFPRTISFLREAFDAVEFEHVNKVGDNSRPNGIALMFGQRIGWLRRDVFGDDEQTLLEPEWTYVDSCKTFLDDKGFIMKEFEEQGYATLMAEDWSSGVFNYPGCWGFKDKATTHYMRPFQWRLEHERHPVMNLWINGTNCHEHHKFLHEYVEKLIDTYPDKPKFGLTWASHLGHDKADPPFHADSYIAEFFKKNREEFDRSFVFFMGDHGLRFGHLRYTDVGRRDVKNPMLHLSVPRQYRDNAALMRNVAKNAKELLTMYDVHATLKDIVQSLGQADGVAEEAFTVPASFDNGKGSSVLRPLPATPRNCKTLPIPFEYCLCEIDKVAVSDPEIVGDLAEVVVSAVNKRLQDEHVTHLCSYQSIAKIVSAYQFKGTTDLYGVIVVLIPGGGRFETFIRHLGLRDYSMIVADALRLNSYGNTADCVDKNSIRPYCFCKQQNGTKTG